MIILGLADGRDASAALVVDGALVARETEARVTGDPGARGMPWRAARAVLDSQGMTEADVDHVAVAGRFTPALFLRRFPGLRRMARDPFSPARDAHAFLQSMWRVTGWGAVEADRARDWMMGQLAMRGYRARRVQMIDVHRCLAASAYRCQPDDDVLVLSLHPMGDGVSVAVHRGEGGQLELAWAQQGMSALHVHLQRCVAALGLDPTVSTEHLSALAGRGAPDDRLLEGLDQWLRPSGPRLEGNRYPVPGRSLDPLYDALRTADRADAAASIVENLRRAVRGLLAYHLARERVRDVYLAGAAVQDPRVVQAAATVDGIHTVGLAPFGGWGALAVGAAASAAGLAPRLPPAEGLGPEVRDADAREALEAAGVRPRTRRPLWKWMARQLEAGHAVARLQDRGGLGRWGLGRSAVLVRADDAAAVEAARSALGRHAYEEPGCLSLRVAHLPDADVLAPALATGTTAVSVGFEWARRHRAVVAPDGRVLLARVDPDRDPLLAAALRHLEATTGCDAVACFPLAPGSEPAVATARDAVRVWRRSGLRALVVGSYGVAAEET